MKVLITATSFSEITREPEDRLVRAGYEIAHNPYGRPMTGEEMARVINAQRKKRQAEQAKRGKAIRKKRKSATKWHREERDLNKLADKIMDMLAR